MCRQGQERVRQRALYPRRDERSINYMEIAGEMRNIFRKTREYKARGLCLKRTVETCRDGLKAKDLQKIG